MVRSSATRRARGRWHLAVGALLVAWSPGCRGAPGPGPVQAVDGPAGAAPAARWTPRFVELTADQGDPNQNLGMVFRIRGTWLAALALAGADDAAPGAVYLFEKDGPGGRGGSAWSRPAVTRETRSAWRWTSPDRPWW